MRTLRGAQALALTTFLSACPTQVEPPRPPRGPIERVDLVRAHQTVAQAIDAAREGLGGNAKAEIFDCREVCAPGHLDCDRTPAAICAIRISVRFISSDPLDMLATLTFYVFVDAMSMEVSGNFLDECDASVGNCHVSIQWSEAVRRVRNACLDGDQRTLLAALTWDNRVQRIVWHVSSEDGTQVGVVWAGGEGKTVCGSADPARG